MKTLIQTTFVALALIAGAASSYAAPVNYANSIMHDAWLGR